ncbi:MAG: hypothetical protein OEQ39_26985, partial [Gammaproteobacteria bacterium]|nr:hypothetical protein [Gammaproteobacteria bacterium]
PSWLSSWGMGGWWDYLIALPTSHPEQRLQSLKGLILVTGKKAGQPISTGSCQKPAGQRASGRWPSFGYGGCRCAGRARRAVVVVVERRLGELSITHKTHCRSEHTSYRQNLKPVGGRVIAVHPIRTPDGNWLRRGKDAVRRRPSLSVY